MMKIDKWHVILFIIALLGIATSGYFLGQTTSQDEAKIAYKESLAAQTEVTKRLVDSLATSNKIENTNIQGDQKIKGNKSTKK